MLTGCFSMKRAILSTVLFLSLPVSYLYVNFNVVEEKELSLKSETEEEEGGTVVEENMKPVRMYPASRKPIYNIFHLCTEMGPFHNMYITDLHTKRSLSIHENLVEGSTSTTPTRHAVLLQDHTAPRTGGMATGTSPTSRTPNASENCSQHAGCSSANQGGDIEKGEAMWKVDMAENSTNGMLNPEEEIARYFGQRIEFQECGDEEVETAVKRENQEDKPKTGISGDGNSFEAH